MSTTRESTGDAHFWCALPVNSKEYPELSSAIQAAQGHVVHYPVVLTEPRPAGELRDLIEPLSKVSEPWILLPSAGAAEGFRALLTAIESSSEKPAPDVSRWQVCTVGAAAAAALQTLPSSMQHRALDEIRAESATGAENPNTVTAHIPRSVDLFVVTPNQAHAPIVSELGRLDYVVNELPLYNRYLDQGGDPVGSYLFQGKVDVIFFPSPEHLRFFRRRLLAERGVLAMLDHVRIYCWDAWTARVAREYGLDVTGITNALALPDQMASSSSDS